MLTRTPPTSAWKHLGVQIPGVKTWKEAAKAAKLDYTVEKLQLTNPFGGVPLPMWGNFRADTKEFVGRSGKDFNIIQNIDSLDWVDTIVQSEAGARYVSAGALGPMIFCLAVLPEQVRIKGTDDITNNYLLFVNFHEAGRSALAKLLGDRLICSNGMTMPVELADVLTIPHRRNAPELMNRSKVVLGTVKHQILDLNSAFNTLARVKLDVQTVGTVIRDVYPNIEDSAQAQNRAREVLELFEDNDGNAFPSEAESAYALMNAFTNFIDHHASARGENEDKARARNALFGAGETLKFTVLTSLVTALGRNSLASFSEKEVLALGIR